MRQGLSVRSWMLFVLVVVAGDAGALSRAMWAEFNAIYYINLRPTAECSVYRARSIDLIKDNLLSAEVLDARMHALWDEAKRSCLQPVRAEGAGAAKQAAGAKQEAVTSSVVAQAPATPAERSAGQPAVPAPVRPAPDAARVADATSAPAVNAGQARSDPALLSAASAAATAARSPSPVTDPAEAASPAAAAALPVPSRPPVPGSPSTAPGGPVVPPVPGVAVPPHIAPPLLKPPIEMPSPADLRLEAACAKRNPYAYQAQSGADPCARFARATSAAGAAVTDGSSNRDWASRIGAGLVVVVAAAAAWAWRRQRARRAQGAPGDQANAVETADGDSLSVRAPA